jgi:predicted ATP-grasp superfamily ATP-dependent carboligase
VVWRQEGGAALWVRGLSWNPRALPRVGSPEDRMDHDLENGRVILTHGRSLMALVAAHSLGKRGVEVIGADSVGLTALSFSRFVGETFLYPDFYKDEAGFVREVAAAARRLEPDDPARPYVLMPMHRDAAILARHRDALPACVRLAAPSWEAIDRIHPKHRLARTLQDLSVRAPRSWLPEDADALEGLRGELPFPVVLKPRDDTGGRGVERVEDFAALRAAFAASRTAYGTPPVVQEAWEGQDYCLTVLLEDGALRAAAAYRNLYCFPPEAGAGALREAVEAKRFTPIAMELLGPLRWNGVAEVDFLWDGRADSTPALIEVNPRFWGGLFQSVESGVDFPWLLYTLAATGRAPTAAPAQVGTRTKIPVIWLLDAVRDALSQDDASERLEAQKHAALNHLRGGEIWDGFAAYADYLVRSGGQVLDIPSHWESLHRALARGRDARPEFFTRDDPVAVLGVLFVLGSLLRYGELPRELRFPSQKKAPPHS